MCVKFAPYFFAVLVLSGCANRPQLYPNEKFHDARTSGQLDADIKDCTELADQYVSDSRRYEDLAKNTAIGGGVGAAAGAVAGTIIGSAARGTAAGAAAGAITSLLQGLIQSSEPSPTYHRFVEYCLQKEGYEVIGWD